MECCHQCVYSADGGHLGHSGLGGYECTWKWRCRVTRPSLFKSFVCRHLLCPGAWPQLAPLPWVPLSCPCGPSSSAATPESPVTWEPTSVVQGGFQGPGHQLSCLPAGFLMSHSQLLPLPPIPSPGSAWRPPARLPWCSVPSVCILPFQGGAEEGKVLWST